MTHDVRTERSTKINLLAIAALVLAVFAILSVIGLGIAVVAVFAVGAGHVALNQIKNRGERGAGLAITALVIAYGLALYGLILSVSYWFALVAQVPPLP